MGVRFRSSFYSTLQNIQYKCEIWDSTYSSTITTITTEGEGFDITYQQQGDERFSPIKGSECSLYCLITDDSAGTLLQNWINTSLNATKEDLYHIAIYRDSSLYWFGVILPDLNGRQDVSKPYSYKITATDGLARMKDKEFTQAVSSYNDVAYGRKTFIEAIWEVLKYSPLYMATSENLLFSTCVGWYEDLMPAKSAGVDPLLYTKIRLNTWLTIQENKEPKGFSYYDVLVSICESWGMRVMFSDGLYRFFQVNAYEDDAITKYQRYYLRSTGGYDGFSTFIGAPVDITNDTYPYVCAGNQWNWYAPLKFVFLKYPFKNVNMLNENAQLTLSTTYKYSQDIRQDIIGTSTSRLYFTTGLSFRTFTPSAILRTAFVKVQIKLKLGGISSDQYLHKNELDPIGAETWNTTTDYWEHIYQVNGYAFFELPLITITTPILPIDTYITNEFEINIVGVYMGVYGSTPYSTANYDIGIDKGTAFLRYSTSSSNDDQQYQEYKAGNTSTPINSYDLKLNDALLGESFDSSNPGQLYVSNGTTFDLSTAQWKYEDTGTALSFNLMRVREVLSGQTIPIRKYQGKLLSGYLDAYNSIEYDGFRYILNGATYSAQSESWEGEWYQVSVDRLSFEDIGDSEPQTGDGGTNGLQRGIGNAWNDGNTALKQINALVSERQITYLSDTITSGATSIFSIEPTGSAIIKQGDFLRIITQNGTNTFLVEVSSDVNATDTTISIISYTFPYDIPSGSIIAFDLQKTMLEYLRIGSQFPDSDPHIVGVLWHDTSNHNIKVSNG